MVTLLVAAAAAAALGGVPQCPPNLASCYYRFDNAAFGDPYTSLDNSGGGFTGKWRDAMCNKTNWLLKEACHEACPLRMRITNPPHLRMTACLRDSVFQPYVPESHMDLNHPLNGQEMELIAAGTAGDATSTRHGCRASDFTDKDYEGKFVIIQRGSCYFYEKFVNAHQTGKAALAVMSNTRTYNNIADQMFGMSGSSVGFEGLPSSFLPSHFGDILLEALDKGEKVMGMMEFSCDPPVLPPPEDVVTDGCPHWGLATEMCNYREKDEDRLCQRCPLELQLPGAENKTCLYGNSMYPHLKRTFFQFSPAYTLPLTTDTVVYAHNMPNGGCTLSDFTPFAGKILFVPYPTCLPMNALRRAMEAGVKGYILISKKTWSTPELMEGPSVIAKIPVHATHPSEFDMIMGALQAGTLNAAGTARTISTATFSNDAVFRDRPVVTEAPPTVSMAEVVVLEERAAWDWSPAVVVSLILIVVAVGLLVALVHNQRANAVELPPSSANASEFSVPLSVASMGLSLSLLMVIAVVAFVLAYNAGQDSTDEAVKNGQQASAQTYQNAVDNVEDLAMRLRQTIIAKVITGIDTAISEGETNAAAVASLYLAFDGTWDSFDAMTETYVSISMKLPWYVNVFTNNGFFLAQDHKTDDRSDIARGDGVVGTVSQTNNGNAYGYIKYWYNRNYQNEFWSATSNIEFNASQMLGGYHGDPLAIVRPRVRQFRQWHITGRTFPQLDETVTQPISVFIPLYNRKGQQMGTVEARTWLTRFGSLVSNAVNERSLRNMTVLVFDAASTVIIGTNAWNNVKFEGQVFKTSYDGYRTSYKLFDLPAVQVQTYGYFRDAMLKEDEKFRTSGKFTGRFDQSDETYYRQLQMNLNDIRVVNGRAADVAGDKWDVEVRGGDCGNCVARDAELGRDVLAFDGKAVLHVYMNLTTETPRVKSTQVPTADGSWKSDTWTYENTMEIDPVTKQRCVSYTDAKPSGTATYCLLRENWQQYSNTVQLKVKPVATNNDPLPLDSTPWLFSDSPFGEANMRLYGNGQMYLNVLKYGCQTKPIPGGLLGGVWTTITAVTSYDRWTCTVYVNGKLHDWSYISNVFYTSEMGTALTVGKGFHGSIDSVQMFNMSLDAAEVQSAYEGAVKRTNKKRMWLVDEAVVDRNYATRAGVRWSVAGMIPREDIMRAVDENNRVTTANLALQEDNTQKKLRQMSNETIMIVIAIALFSVLLFLAFNDRMTRPFAACAVTMTEAAVMRVEEITEEHSFIREINAMNRATVLMLKNLREYKSYMPQSLCLNDDDDLSGTEDSRSAVSKHSNSFSKHSRSSRGTSRSFSTTAGASTRQGRAQENASRAGATRNLMSCSLMKKKVTYVVVNVRDWFSRISRESDSDVLHLHSQLLAVALSQFAASKGIAEPFSGDRFCGSFNGAKALGTHRLAACVAVMGINTIVDEKSDLKISLSCSVVSGEGRVGNMGNEQMKKFSFLSSIIPWGHALERYCRSTNLSILCDGFMFDDVRAMVNLRHLGEIEFQKRSRQKPIKFAEMTSLKAATEGDEWMYELEAGEKSDPHKAWNAWVAAVTMGEWEV